MTPRSPFQRFTAELRRRHVPQTVAVYVVAAWAAIQFADVVVPNLGWPQWVVTAVIVASAIGLPVVLLLSWFLEWGPEGVHRTPDASEADGSTRTTGVTEAASGSSVSAPGRTAAGAGASRTAWVATISVLAVTIVAAMVAAVMLGRGGVAPGDVEQAAAVAEQDAAAAEGNAAATRFERRRQGTHPDIPTVPDLEGIMSGAFGDSVVRSISDSITRGVGQGSDLNALVEMATRIGAAASAAETSGPVVMTEPRSWQFGAPYPVRAEATLRIQGVARDSTGVMAVEVAGRVVARSDGLRELPFQASWTAGAATGPFQIPVIVRNGAGEEVRRDYPVTVVPGGQD